MSGGSVDASGAREAFAITKSDSTIVNIDALYVGGTGAVAVQPLRGNSVTFSAVPAGTILPVKCTKVLSTGTDATLMVGLKY